MRAIWKFPLEVVGAQVVRMPLIAVVLCVQMQSGVPCLWAICDTTSNEKASRVFRIFGTGHEIGDYAADKYVGTFQTGGFVFHVFED